MKRGNHLVCSFLRLCIRQMKALGLNNTSLAARLKVSRPYVTKLLSGDVNISFGAAERLAKALQMGFIPTLALREGEGRGERKGERGENGRTNHHRCFPSPL